MTRCILLLLALLLSACAGAPRAPAPGAEIFRDELFGAAPPPPDPQALFGLSPEMRRYLTERIQPQVRRKGPQYALLEALYTEGELRLDYDAAHTRSASEAFAAGKGNCLSLVVMTAAFAREMGLQVRYQEVLGAPAVEQNGDLTFLVGHVNLGLGSVGDRVRSSDFGQHWVLVDFLPGQDLRNQRTTELDERRVRAMYMNNRAAESVAAGQLREAYWWLRAAHAQDASLANLYNTLAVVYRRQGAFADAERTLRVAQAMDPDNEVVAGNLASLQREGGPVAAAAAAVPATARLPALATRFDPARQALQDGQPKVALRWLSGQLGLTPRNPELHYWLAMTYAQAGDSAGTRRHLELATEYSAGTEQRGLYAGKLNRLKAQAAEGALRRQ